MDIPHTMRKKHAGSENAPAAALVDAAAVQRSVLRRQAERVMSRLERSTEKPTPDRNKEKGGTA